jgi:hypothetical protein
MLWQLNVLERTDEPVADAAATTSAVAAAGAAIAAAADGTVAPPPVPPTGPSTPGHGARHDLAVDTAAANASDAASPPLSPTSPGSSKGGRTPRSLAAQAAAESKRRLVDSDGTDTVDDAMKGKLIKAEQREVGSVDTAVYKAYISGAGGIGFFFIMAMFYVVGEVCRVGSSFWLGVWAADNIGEDGARVVHALALALHCDDVRW